MFTVQELNYILAAIQQMPINSTDDARYKGLLTYKVADIMDAQAAAEAEAAKKAAEKPRKGKKE